MLQLETPIEMAYGLRNVISSSSTSGALSSSTSSPPVRASKTVNRARKRPRNCSILATKKTVELLTTGCVTFIILVGVSPSTLAPNCNTVRLSWPAKNATSLLFAVPRSVKNSPPAGEATHSSPLSTSPIATPNEGNFEFWLERLAMTTLTKTRPLALVESATRRDIPQATLAASGETIVRLANSSKVDRSDVTSGPSSQFFVFQAPGNPKPPFMSSISVVGP